MPASPSSPPGRRPDPAVRALWQERLHRFEKSGLSAAAFCAQQRLSLPSFYAWRRRLRQATPDPAPAPTAAQTAPRFLPVRVLPAPAASAVELVLPQGVVLRLVPGCDLAFVRSVVQSLGGVSC